MAESQFPVRELVLAIFKANGQLVETGNHLVQPLGLTAAWWQVLGALGYAPVPLPVAHIARNMGLSRQAVQRVTDRLSEIGLVRLEPNPHHQRAKLVVLTDAGRSVLEQAEAVVLSLDEKILQRLGRERLEMARGVLREMIELLEKES